ncbi:MAG: polysulfide reductase NrfD [Thiogranum sp.]|jgi:formate-dependent nitrite reductase membrane component NrfD|nr:polysulfide reductase NrfD [Thiogranum sp.]
MLEEILVSVRSNPHIDPVMSVWGWEISVYLFLGGLAAGIMFFSALMLLLNKDDEAPFSVNGLALLGPVVLSLGMTTLFLDLSHKLFVWRFYTTFEPTSPMSYGAWILILFYPVGILQILSTLRKGYPYVANLVNDIPPVAGLLDLVERYQRLIAWLAIPIAVALGIYTGILLSAFSARPFWNTGLLGPLFLVSGLSTGAALTALIARQHSERRLLTRIDAGLIVVELLVVALLLINLTTGSKPQLDAAAMLMGGSYTGWFWVVFVALGLLVPLALEYFEIRGSASSILMLAPVLVLVGGYVLRVIAVDLGQETTWINYQNEFNTQLLDRLH